MVELNKLSDDEVLNLKKGDVESILKPKVKLTKWNKEPSIEDLKNDLTQAQTSQSAFVSNLDFGAVDLIWNEHENKCYVLEVNSAPGIEGTTLQQYVTAFAKDIKNV